MKTEEEAEGEDAPGRTALLIVDMINDLAFEGGEPLRKQAERLAEPLLALREAASAAGVPVVYVNDNYGQWHSERSRIVEYCSREDARGRDLTLKMQPRHQDYFVIKPQFSGFYATNLPVLLPKLGVDRLILAGIAADICVLFTAADAHMRAYDLWVPADCIAASDPKRSEWALSIMAHSMGADIRPTNKLPLRQWVALA